MTFETKNKELASFDFRTLFTFSVRTFYRSVSSSVENIYENDYGLTTAEWRTLVVLGPYQCLAAKEIVKASSMDKVTVSRAVKTMQAKNILKRDIDGDDKRRSALRLTQAGRDIYFSLMPKVLTLQDSLLAGFTQAEIDQFSSLMSRVSQNAERADNPIQDLIKKTK